MRACTLAQTFLLTAALGLLAGCSDDEVGCPTGLTDCDGSCVDLAIHPEHCGGCETACAEGEICDDGTCAVSCGAGLTECNGVCIDTHVDPNNCGACAVACAEGEVCSEGECSLTCGSGLTNCDGACIDTDRDPINCGACAVACAEGEVCSGGECALSCAAGLTECDGLCRDLNVDRANCGACGNACGVGEVCSGGECALSCAAGLTECDGLCRDLNVDRANCGACGTVCDPGEVCSEGECALSCGGATPTRCGDACVDTDNDRHHCGGCDAACAPGEVCSGGECALSCGGATPTRCGDACVDTDNDRHHCGGCDAACALGEVCADGLCGASCGEGLDLCDGACTNLDWDPSNCGECGNACGEPDHADMACVSGSCRSWCESGYGDCNEDLGEPETDGCEVDLSTDNESCGACGIECGPRERCEDGVCETFGCDGGTYYGSVCRTRIGRAGVNWTDAARFCFAEGDGQHLCTPAEYHVLFANDGFPSWPDNHGWTDGAEGDQNHEIEGFYGDGRIDDWHIGDTGGFATCCQTHPETVNEDCEGTDVGGVCLIRGGPRGASFSEAANYCNDLGYRLCTMAEAGAICRAGRRPDFAPGTSFYWLDGGEGDNNQEQTGMYGSCVFDDWPHGTDATALCCQTTVPDASGDDCPGTEYDGVCLTRILSSVDFYSYAAGCFRRGDRPCTAAEARLICLRGGLEGSSFYWVDGSEGQDNQEASGIYNHCDFDDWPTGTRGGGPCCR